MLMNLNRMTYYRRIIVILLILFSQGHVFLDTMDPREYYAQALNGHRPAPIKVCLYSKEANQM